MQWFLNLFLRYLLNCFHFYLKGMTRNTYRDWERKSIPFTTSLLKPIQWPVSRNFIQVSHWVASTQVFRPSCTASKDMRCRELDLEWKWDSSPIITPIRDLRIPTNGLPLYHNFCLYFEILYNHNQKIYIHASLLKTTIRILACFHI